MSLFSKKQEVNIVDFCRSFYENIFLKQMIGNTLVSDDNTEIARQSIAETDQRFKNIAPQKFRAELLPLQFELFALAWLHKLGENLSVAQSLLTKQLLHEKDLDSIWIDMDRYNKAIVRSSNVGLDKINLTLNMKKKADIADRYIAFSKTNGIDIDESMGRPINRLFSENAWKKGTTPGFLMFAFCDALGFEENFHPNEEGQIFLITLIRDIYDVVMESLDKIKIKK